MDEKFSGEVTQKTPDGSVTVTFFSGKKHGPTRFVSDRGVVTSEIQYENDVIHGKVRQFYKSGKLMSEITYVNGAQSGTFVSFSENGMKQMESSYSGGELSGQFIAFDEFGDIAAERSYANGVMNGKSSLYYSKTRGGHIYELSFYENGLLEGDKVTFYATGEVMSITKYKAGKAQTYPQNFDRSGNISKRM
ncbi:MAG: toxin-antitoxin system YwqK family antitoxin [Holosporales bacterium]|jgi:antitoxin component YwqK of YwqJK toxin-antitoxin module|nr:toxin-antitoxin system YwqK family antitoxin [Holosporales bacterium]